MQAKGPPAPAERVSMRHEVMESVHTRYLAIVIEQTRRLSRTKRALPKLNVSCNSRKHMVVAFHFTPMLLRGQDDFRCDFCKSRKRARDGKIKKDSRNWIYE